jgi:hypothetical protein
VEGYDSTTSLTDIFTNADTSGCPDQCTGPRPVGLALDSQDRLFVSSDSSGEIWVLSKSGATPTSSSSATVTGTPTATASHKGDAGAITVPCLKVVLMFLAMISFVV